LFLKNTLRLPAATQGWIVFPAAIKAKSGKYMIDSEFIRELSEKAARLFPDTAGVREELEANLRKLLQTSFDKLNLVTREEFESQLAALRRAEATIAALEEKVSSLESQAGQ
jgi:BMFP domain-containing protein YqiC